MCFCNCIHEKNDGLCSKIKAPIDCKLLEDFEDFELVEEIEEEGNLETKSYFQDYLINKSFYDNLEAKREKRKPLIIES